MSKLVESLKWYFRHQIVYPLLRLIIRNPMSVTPIDYNRVHRILIFRYDRIGDMIVTTPILRMLKRLSPGIRLDVLASKANSEVLHRNSFVDNILILETNWFRLLRQIVHLRKQRYDVVFNFIFNRTTGPGILANVIAPDGFKVGQGPDRFAFYFNRLVKVRRFEQHMLESYVSMVEQAFGVSVDREDLAFQVSVDSDSRHSVDEWLKDHSLHRRSQPMSQGLPYVVLNPSGKVEDRSLGTDQVVALARRLSGKSQFSLVVLDSPGNTTISKAIRNKAEFEKSVVFGTLTARPLGELASLIEGALLVISPDTSIIHFASAMQTPVLAIYAPMNASQEWLPHKVYYEIIMAKGNQRISEIEPQDLMEGAERFIGKVLDVERIQSSELK